MRYRVKITGLGPVTPAGIGKDAFARGIAESVSRVRKISRFDDAAGDFVAAELVGFNVDDWIKEDAKQMRRLPRQTQLGLAATALALLDAGITREDLADLNPFVISGSVLIDPGILVRTIKNVSLKGPGAAVPSVVSEALPSATGRRIADFLKVPTRTMCLSSACCGGLDAIGYGADMVASGQAELVICCGTDAPIAYHPMLELGVASLSPRNATEPASMGRPFDLWRNCGVIGEGAAAIVLERETSPRPAQGWVTGYAYAQDPDSEPGGGLSPTMSMALANAGVHADGIDFINAWGPGHTTVDRIEAEAIHKIFGRKTKIPVASIKGAIGNPLAAAGAIQVVSSSITLTHGVIPPTVNWVTSDPECALNLSGSARNFRPRRIMINAHGINGGNASLILERS